MNTSFQTVLSALCTRVELVNSTTDAYDIYLLGDAKEAKLAYDVLLAHGFEAKFYSEAGDSKLYVTRPAAPPADVEKRLQLALSYADALKNMKRSVEALLANRNTGMEDFTLTFGNTPAGKQITVLMTQPAAAVRPPAQPQARTPLPAPPQAKAPVRPKPEEHEMFNRTELAKSYHFIKTAPDHVPEDRTVSNWLSRLFVQNIASNGTIILMMVVIGCVIITFVITSMGFLCPDLAVNQRENIQWYCQNFIETDQERITRNRKQRQLEEHLDPDMLK